MPIRKTFAALITLFIVTVGTVVSSGQSLRFEWVQELGPSINKAVSAKDGRVAVTGITEAGDIYVRVYGADGTQLWSREFGTEGKDEARGITIDASGNVYLAGIMEGDVFLRLYDSKGGVIWTRIFDTVSSDSGLPNPALDPHDNIYFASAGNVHKITVSGELLWTRRASGDVDALVADSSGVYVAVHDARETFVRKYHYDGLEAWSDRFATNSLNGIDLSLDGAGHLFLSGAALRKYDASIGGVIWTKDVKGVAIDVNGRIFLSVESASSEIAIEMYDTFGIREGTLPIGSIAAGTAWQTAMDGSVFYVAGVSDNASFVAKLQNPLTDSEEDTQINPKTKDTSGPSIHALSAGGTAVTWNGGTGSWNVAANWSPAVVPCNTAAAQYDVFIDASAAVNSVVTLNSACTVNNLTIGSGDQVIIANGRSLAITGDSTPGAGIINNGGTLTLSSAGSLTDFVILGNVTLTGGGAVVLGNHSANRIYGSAAAHTLTNVNNTIRGAGQIGANQMAMVNEGTVVADVTTPMVIDPGPAFVNRGIFRSSGTSILRLQNGNFTNTAGSIVADSIITLNAATVTGGILAGTGQIQNIGNATLVDVTNNGTVVGNNGTLTQLAGTIINAGSFTLNSAGSLTDLIIQGDVTLTGGGVIVLGNHSANRIYGVAAGNTLTNVNNTIRGGGQIGANQMILVNRGTVLANVSTSLVLDPASSFVNENIFRAAAGSTLRLVNGTFTNTGATIVADGTVELNGATVAEGTLIGNGFVNIGTATLANLKNAGTFRKDNGTSTLLAGTIENAGKITLNSAGSLTDLIIQGNVTLAGGGEVVLGSHSANRIYGIAAAHVLTNSDNTIHGGGQIGANQMVLVNRGSIVADASVMLTLDPSGTFTNEATYKAASGSTLRLLNGTFSGGDIVAAGTVEVTGSTISAATLSGSGLVRNIGTATLSNITNQGTFHKNNGTSSVLIGTITNSGTFTLNSAGSLTDLIIQGNVTLTGGGSIVMGNHSANRIYGSSAADVLTNENNTIRGGGQIGANQMGLINRGTILADTPTLLTLDPAAVTFINEGTFRSVSGSTMRLLNGTFANSSVIVADGVVEISGSIVSGLLTGTGTVRNISTATLSNITNSGTYVQNNGTTTLLVGTITNSGSMSLNSAGSLTDMTVQGNVTLTGGGTVILGNHSANRIYGVAAGNVLTNVNNTVRGGGQIGANQMVLINKGTILANVSTTLTLDPASSFLNEGIFRAAAGSVLRLTNGTFNNSSVIVADGVVELSGAVVAGGTFTGTGSVRNIGSATLSNLANATTLQMLNGTLTQLVGTIVNTGSMNLMSAGSLTDLIIQNNVTLTGTGVVVMGNHSANRIYGIAADDVLTNASTIQGGGQIGANQMGLINQGSLIANVSTPLVVDPSAAGVTNTGVFSVAAGSVLRLQNGTFTNAPPASMTSDGRLEITGSTFFGKLDIDPDVVVTSSTINPGLSPGIINIDGTYTHTSPSVLRIELGGTTPGTGYDQLNVSGLATIGGTMQVSLIDGFVPSPCQAFTVMTFGSRSGNFTFAGLTLSGGMALRPVVGPNSIVLVAYNSSSPINVHPANVAVAEGGATADYAVCLATTAPPTAPVNISATPDSQVTVSSSLLTFDPASNWNLPQAVTVAAVDDGFFEGLHSGSVSHAASSADPTFNGRPVASVIAAITDNDIDNAPPVTTATPAGTAGANGWWRSSVTVTLSCTDAGSGCASTNYRVDGGAFAQYSAPFAVTGEGMHVVEFFSTDVVGNIEATKNLAINIDVTAPSTSGAWSGAGPLTVTLTAADATSGVAKTEYRIDGGATQIYAGPFSVSASSSHTIEFWSTDNAGNVESTKTLVTPAAPTAEAGGPYTVNEGASITLAGSCTNCVSFAWDLDNDGEYDDSASASPAFSAAGIDGPSSKTVGLKVTGGDGLVATDAATVNIANVAPVITSTPGTTATEGSTYSYQPAAVDAAGALDPLTWTLLSAPAGTTINSSTGLVTLNPVPGSSPLSFSIRVSDGDGGLVDQSWTVTVDLLGVASGRMTGGGSVFTAANERVTHGLTLSCNASANGQNLQINWGRGNRFHLDAANGVRCFNDPALPANTAGFNTITGQGSGSYNGASGAAVTFTFTDAGEPGRNDGATITVRDRNGNVVLQVSGTLAGGNHQAHRN